jgi:Ni/Co efflux regulator RcnB
MQRVLFALLAPAAIAATLTASASAAVLSPKGPVIDKSTAATDVAYRAVRRTTVRGPRGAYHSRTVVRGGRYYGARGVYARRGVYVRGGRYYGAGYYGPRYYGYYRPGVYASRGVYVRGGRYYGRGGVYARRGFYGHRAAYRRGGRVYASRAVGVRRR